MKKKLFRERYGKNVIRVEEFEEKSEKPKVEKLTKRRNSKRKEA